MNLEDIKHRTHSNDEIYTPPSLAKALIEQTSLFFDEEDSFYDPFYGLGAFFDNFPHHFNNCFTELNLGSDFFRFEGRSDWIISNPPFSQLTKILEKSTLIAEKGICYILPSYSLTCRRIRIMKSMGFNISKIVFFENPKEWRLGFQMLYVIFTRENNPSFTCLVEEKTLQTRLGSFDE